MTTTNLLGGSRRSKNSSKNYYEPNFDLITPGSGISMSYNEVNTAADWTSANANVHNVPWGTDTSFKELVISVDEGGLSGWSGTVTASGTYVSNDGTTTTSGSTITYTIANGLITDVSVA